jgi:hypothetical protein
MVLSSSMCEQVEVGGAAPMCDQEKSWKIQGNEMQRMVPCSEDNGITRKLPGN